MGGNEDGAIPATSTHKALSRHNLNGLLRTYPGATGLKTGLTGNAGGCMLATATRDGRHLIVGVLNATLHSTPAATALLHYRFSLRTDAPVRPSATGHTASASPSWSVS